MVTVAESPLAVPATPTKLGVVSFVELPLAGCVSVTAGGVVSAEAFAKCAWIRAAQSAVG